MNHIVGFTGRLGSGKWHNTMKYAEKMKTDGYSVFLTSFADPIKKFIRMGFGMNKSGFEHLPEPLTRVVNEKYVFEHCVGSLRLGEQSAFDEFRTVLADHWLTLKDAYDSAITTSEKQTYDLAYRKIIQTVGTEVGRSVSETLWIEHCINECNYALSEGLADICIIDDVRFWNEKEAIEAAGGIVYGVECPPEIRAERRGLTVEQMVLMDSHSSENAIDQIIASLPPVQTIKGW